MIHYGRFFVVFGRHFSRLLINSTIMEGWECRSICSRDSQKFADCATSPLPAILGVILLEIKVSCTAKPSSKGDAVPLRYPQSSVETFWDIPLSSAQRTRPCRCGTGSREKVRQSWTFFRELNRRTAVRHCLRLRERQKKGTPFGVPFCMRWFTFCLFLR